MKRMVKNGNLIDVEPDGTMTVAGKPIGGGGGGDYTAGSNIEISESKAISLKNSLTNLNTIRFKNGFDGFIISSPDAGQLKIKGQDITNFLPKIVLEPWNPAERKQVKLIFNNYISADQSIYFDTSETSEDKYAFLVRGSKVPSVPSGDGNYILKASVSGGAVNYTWELQQ